MVTDVDRPAILDVDLVEETSMSLGLSHHLDLVEVRVSVDVVVANVVWNID